MTTPDLRSRLSARESLFCRILAAGAFQDDAYKRAGYKPDRANASHLANRPDIRVEVQRLQEVAAETQQFTADWWREQYLTLWKEVRGAPGDSGWEVANSLLDKGAKVLGLYNRGDPDDAAKRSHELNLVLAQLMGKQVEAQKALIEGNRENSALPRAVYQVIEATRVDAPQAETVKGARQAHAGASADAREGKAP